MVERLREMRKERRERIEKGSRERIEIERSTGNKFVLLSFKSSIVGAFGCQTVCAGYLDSCVLFCIYT